jgi:Uma2 family endonuclease
MQVIRIVAEPTRTKNGYPTSDGRPMAETDLHRWLMTDLIETLTDWYKDDPDIYVSGNLLLFYVQGNKRKHISPDVFVVLGVPKRNRDNYLMWEEKKGPSIVIELTSSSTRKEDTDKKFTLYRDVLKVPEYFMFDPYGDYLNPRFQGYRRVAGQYRPIRLSDDRMASRQLGLSLEVVGNHLRLVDMATGNRLPTRSEVIANAEAMQSEAEAEIERLRRELDEIKRERRYNGSQGGSRNGE